MSKDLILFIKSELDAAEKCLTTLLFLISMARASLEARRLGPTFLLSSMVLLRAMGVAGDLRRGFDLGVGGLFT